MVLGSVGRDYSNKNRVLEFLAKIFGQFASAPLRIKTHLLKNHKCLQCLH